MPGTNQNAPQLIRHFSKHSHPHANDIDFYIENIGSSIRESLVVLDQNLQIYFANRAFCDLLQVDVVNAKGCHCYELGNRALDTPEFRRLLEEVLLNVTTVEDFEVTLRLADGSVRSLLMNARVLAREHQPRFTLLVTLGCTARAPVAASTWQNESLLALMIENAPVPLAMFDTERALHAVRSELAMEVRGLTRLNEASSLLWRTRDLSEGLQEMLQATIDVMSADYGNIQLLDPDRQVLTIAAHQGFAQEFLDTFREVDIADACACGRALRTKQRLIVEDVEVDEEYAPYRAIAHMSHYRAVQSTPLLSPHGKALGMISTHWRLPHRPSTRELARLDLFARQLAEFVWRSQMDQQLREQEAFVNSILAIEADAIITIDQQSHIVRVNAATEKMFGFNASDLIGRSISVLMPSVSSQEITAILKHHLEPDSARVSVNKREFLGMRKCGSSFPLQVSASEVDHLGMFTIIVRDISDRCRLQREIVTIAEDEQRKIGQELHDSAQQELTAVSLLATVLLDHLNGLGSNGSQANQEKCADLAAKIKSGIKRANEDVRQISHGLIPLQLNSKGLIRELRQLALQTDALKSVQCTFSSSTAVEIAEDFTATHLFKIAQEAVTNCLKHAHAKHIHIELQAEESAIVLRISDDGQGITEQTSRGVGLRSMEHRAHLINGILKLTNLDQGGSLLTCTVFNSDSTHVV